MKKHSLYRLVNVWCCFVIFFICIENSYSVDKLQKTDISRIKDLCKQGVQQYKKGEFYPAMDSFLQVLILEPKNVKASRYLKKAVEKMLEPERLRIQKESEEIYKRAQKSIAKREKKLDIKKQYRLAIKNYNKGYYLWASEQLNGIIEINPDYENVKKYVQEIKDRMNETAQKDSLPDAEKLYYAKGYVFYQNKNLTDAMNFWERIMAIDPSHKEVKEYYGNVKDYLRNLAETERVEKLIAELKEIYKKGETKYTRKEYVDAINNWEVVVNKSRNEKDSQLAQLNLQASNGIGNALEMLRKISAVKPPPPDVPAVTVEETVVDKKKAEEYYKQGLINYAQGRIGDASRNWELALRYDPENKKIQKAIEKVKMEIDLQKK